MLAAARCDEGLSLRDLIKPERVRVLRVLSAIINLQKFKVEKLVWYTEQEKKKVRRRGGDTQRRARARAAHSRSPHTPRWPPVRAQQFEVLQRKDAIDSQHEDVKRRIDAERSLRDSEAPSIAAAQAQRRELEAQRNERSARLEELRASTKGTKEDLLALRDEVQAQQARIAETRAAVDATRAMVIASPEKIKAELVSLEAAAEAEQGALDAAELRRRLISRQLEVITKADKDVTKAMTLMAEAEVRRGVARRRARSARQWLPRSLLSARTP